VASGPCCEEPSNFIHPAQTPSHVATLPPSPPMRKILPSASQEATASPVSYWGPASQNRRASSLVSGLVRSRDSRRQRSPFGSTVRGTQSGRSSGSVVTLAISSNTRGVYLSQETHDTLNAASQAIS